MNEEIADYRVEDDLYMWALGYGYEGKMYEEFELERPYVKEDGLIVYTELRLEEGARHNRADILVKESQAVYMTPFYLIEK